MSIALGIDTSNYTTSAALFDSETGELCQNKLLLPVKEGQLGLRQSDAVFHHVRQLPTVIADLRSECDLMPDVIGVSTRPRPIEGSYMPCFEVGRSCCAELSSLLGLPMHCFSHQEGHIAAALYSAGCLDTIGSRFAAFHVSGGTTEAVLVNSDGVGYSIDYLCGSLDLKAGQLVDRVAGMLGLAFPGGKQLDALSQSCDTDIRCKPTMKGMDCCLSGIENKCGNLLSKGESGEYIAKYCLTAIAMSLLAMHDSIIERYGDLPVIFAGGVSSNTLIRRILTERTSSVFAAPEFSCDNAAGVALLAARACGRM